MSDTSITKVQSRHSPRGEMGQRYLASGTHVAMRLWESEQPGPPDPPASRDYETVGYVITGRAELHLEGQTVLLEPGDSWTVPPGSAHAYRILEPFTAVEATGPPAFVQGRDREVSDSGRPGGGRGRVDVTGRVPRDIRVDPNITEGHPGYEESGDSEIIPTEQLVKPSGTS